ncbi:hypothetical protein [Nocardia pneumoniae]|uniref:hypothetical protein n=1 Tax=Nocardia pneumoniae TaxID=228601 RepID=UPI000301177B|nr:hypothetical protein [Nocardia pneumoniae]
MTRTNMELKQKTVSLPSTPPSPEEPAERGGNYQLFNDTGMHVSVYRQERDVPKELFVLEPGHHSNWYQGGHEIFIMYVEHDQQSPVTWHGSGLTFQIAYHTHGYPPQNTTTNISYFG